MLSPRQRVSERASSLRYYRCCASSVRRSGETRRVRVNMDISLEGNAIARFTLFRSLTASGRAEGPIHAVSALLRTR